MHAFHILMAISLSLTLARAGHSRSCIGPDYPPAPPLLQQDLCADFTFYGRVGNVPAYVNVSVLYGETTYGQTIVTEKDENPRVICGPEVAGFEVCLGYSEVQISDEWCRICPQLVLKRTSFPPTEQKQSMPCIFAGDDHLDDVPQIVQGCNQFTFDLLGTETLPSEMDAFVSPFSLINALVMPLLAAGGDTKTQILDAFHIDKPNIRWGEAFDVLRMSLEHSDPDVEIQILNRLWLAASWMPMINPDIEANFSKFGQIESSDFLHGPQIETYLINEWVKKWTRGQIDNALDYHNLTAQTVSLFTSLLYTQAKWETPFLEEEVFQFTDDQGETVSVTMMRMDEATFATFSDAHVEVIEIPFSGEESDISMIIVRPAQEDANTTEHIESTLTKQKIDEWLSQQTPKHFDEFYFPRFEMFNIHDVTKVLQSLGIVDLFDPTKADLRALTTAHYAVFEDAINRQDKFRVDANGIEASALATDGTGHDRAQQGPVYHADRPFLFLVMDRTSDVILFVGRVTNPMGWRREGGNDPAGPHPVFHVGLFLFFLVLIGVTCYCGVGFLVNSRESGTNGIENVPHIDWMRSCFETTKTRVRAMLGKEEDDSDQMIQGEDGTGYTVPTYRRGPYAHLEQEVEAL